MYALKFEVRLTIFYFFLPQLFGLVDNIPNFIYIIISEITGIEQSLLQDILPVGLKELIAKILNFFNLGEHETTTYTTTPIL
jgi:hypothetical protein